MTCSPFVPSVVLTATLFGCASPQLSPEKIDPRSWKIPVEGQLASISVSDLAAVVRAMHPTKIYRLRIINHNRVEADTTSGWVTVGEWKHGHHTYRRFYSQESPAYTEVERVDGVWQVNGQVAITY